MNGPLSSGDLAEYGCCWIKGHKRQFYAIMEIVEFEAQRGNPCVQRGDIYMLAKHRGLSISDVRELRRDNSLWSVLTRYMVMLRPYLARALRFRKCGLDSIDLVDKWHRYVNPRTVFLADNWRQAVSLVEMCDAAGELPKKNPPNKVKRWPKRR